MSWTVKAADVRDLAITMELGNAAMHDDPDGDLHRMFDEAVPEISECIRANTPDRGIFIDANGNTIGTWRVK
jgi:hypothetical protein